MTPPSLPARLLRSVVGVLMLAAGAVVLLALGWAAVLDGHLPRLAQAAVLTLVCLTTAAAVMAVPLAALWWIQAALDRRDRRDAIR